MDDPTDDEIVSSRMFPVSREALFGAFADPRKLARWWGPEGFTSTFDEFDFRPGGTWRFTMHGPDGTDYPNVSVFEDIAAPDRIVFRHLEPVHGFTMTMTFAEEDGGTLLTWRMRFATPGEGRRLREFIPKANQQNFDRLQAVLDSQP